MYVFVFCRQSIHFDSVQMDPRLDLWKAFSLFKCVYIILTPCVIAGFPLVLLCLCLCVLSFTKSFTKSQENFGDRGVMERYPADSFGMLIPENASHPPCPHLGTLQQVIIGSRIKWGRMKEWEKGGVIKQAKRERWAYGKCGFDSLGYSPASTQRKTRLETMIWTEVLASAAEICLIFPKPQFKIINSNYWFDKRGVSWSQPNPGAKMCDLRQNIFQHFLNLQDLKV